MFRIEFFVDDKKLGNALHALVGITHGQPNVQPVSNVMKRQNGLVSAVKGDSSTEQLINYLKKTKPTQFAARDLGPVLKTMGLSPTSAGYLVRKVAETGFLRKVRKGMKVTWQLTGKG